MLYRLLATTIYSATRRSQLLLSSSNFMSRLNGILPDLVIDCLYKSFHFLSMTFNTWLTIWTNRSSGRIPVQLAWYLDRMKPWSSLIVYVILFQVASWWDYGYQTTAMANRTVIVDNNTWNNTHIATVGTAMSSPEKAAWEIFNSLDVKYVLVVFGG